MTSYLFAGPSLPDAHELAGNAIEVLPPVRGGDILRLPLTVGDVLGIIDGLFHQQHAVRHKEILAALAAGVRVLGAASMGALRAAELHPYGMQGVGGIYRDYRDGVLVADDEVALIHGPAETGYRPLSQPLVNIRATLSAAQDHGMLDAPTRNRILSELSTMWYQRRTYPVVMEIAAAAGMGAAAVDALRAFCTNTTVDRKRADALELLDRLRNKIPAPPAFELSHTTHLRNWRFRARGTDIGDGLGWVADGDILRACQLFAADFPDFYRVYVLSKIAAECVDACGTTADEADRHPAQVAIAHGVHRSFYPPPVRPAGFAFLSSWLTSAERDTLDLEAQLCTYLIRSYAVAPGSRDSAALVAALTGTPVAAARTLVHAARTVHETVATQRPGFDIRALSAQRITEWFATRWGYAVTDLDFAALDRGLESHDEVVSAARPFYLTARYNPELTRLTLDGNQSSG